MCEFRRAVFVAVFEWSLHGGSFLEPCSELFKFQRSGPDIISAQIEFENDMSQMYRLELKLSIPIYSNESVKIVRNTSEEDLRNGKNVVYDVQFPKKQRSESTIPTPITIIFNKKIYCNDAVPYDSLRVQTLYYDSSPFNSRSLNLWPKLWPHAISRESESQKSSRSKRTSREIPKEPSECGIRRYYFPLILEGTTTKEGEYPWLVALFYLEALNYKFRCAGTLISNRHVVTGNYGHTHDNTLTLYQAIDKTKLYTVFGGHSIENWITKSIYRNAEKIIVHPDYVNISDADVAVITIDTPVPFSDLIRPICLWDEAIDVANVIGEKGTIAGWGVNESGNKDVNEARQIDISIVGEATCLRSNFQFFRITSRRTFCAGERDGKIPCRGDRGSGFVMRRGGRWKLRGVVSSALIDSETESCDGSNYAVFTDVPHYNTWLTSILTEAYKAPSATPTIDPRTPSNDDMKVICHFTNWAGYRKGAGKFLPEDIDSNLCTHIIYGYAALDKTSLTLKPLDTRADIDNKFYKKIIEYRSKGVKVLIALGGWNDSFGDKYSRLVNNATARTKFIVHITKFIEEWGFDGLDLQWNHPKCWQVQCNKGPDSDKPAFAQFVKELHKTFAPRGWFLSAAVGNGKEIIDNGYDVPKLSKYLDWIVVVNYDYHGDWDKKTGHLAPLYYSPGDTSDTLNTNYTIQYLIKLGADPTKLIMRMPQYGRSFTLADSTKHGLNSESQGPGLAGEFTTAPGFLAFYEICAKIKQQSWNVKRDPKGRIGPYAYKGNQWVGYDDIAEFKRKSQYVKTNGLGGGMIWALDLDDFRNTCGCGRYPLLRMMNHELRGVPLDHNLTNCT